MRIPHATLILSKVVFKKLPHLSTASLGLAKARPPRDFSFDCTTGVLTISAAEQTPRVKITFFLEDSKYILAGLAFTPKRGVVKAGRTIFPKIAVTRTDESSTLVVTNDYAKNGPKSKTFPLRILVQRVSDGAIGEIDPGIINNPNEN
ncbi:hypothetical protein [Synoicihabitans lomoniglobus]|uniref:Uncharacterized protein n=1 Tax=Synoicihabitans lomoniglobus TaxID=2909285 RepID=A0AAF0A010_9BACT|nr:hypothetical protein [Opitutaceae bacterium LMO-M01]WED64678.1 hypothetical protein PXH66_20230 [Opitutaceae bacterium LMO-M01]